MNVVVRFCLFAGAVRDTSLAADRLFLDSFIPSRGSQRCQNSQWGVVVCVVRREALSQRHASDSSIAA